MSKEAWQNVLSSDTRCWGSISRCLFTHDTCLDSQLLCQRSKCSLLVIAKEEKKKEKEEGVETKLDGEFGLPFLKYRNTSTDCESCSR